jgi:hypothetical protein
MFRKIKEKFRKIPTPFRQVLFVLLIIILSPVIILLGLELLMQTFHLPYKIDSYLTKKSYSRDVSVTFMYKGEEYVINATEKCINRGVSFSTGNMKWHTVWDNTWENDTITLKDGIKAKAWFSFRWLQDSNDRNYSYDIRHPKTIVNVEIKNAERNPKFIAGKKRGKTNEPMFEPLDLKIISISLGEIKKLPTKFFNSYFDD